MYERRMNHENLPMQNSSVLEQIAGAYTRMEDIQNEQYGIDNCTCGSCWCFKKGVLLILSPAALVTKVATFGPLSAAGLDL
ncbi:MAG: hypothetical protein ABIJ21_05785 [Nanoarchaeota archaeon]